MTEKKTLLKIFCGEPRGLALPPVFATPDWNASSIDIAGEAKNGFRPQVRKINKMGSDFDAISIQHVLQRFTITDALDVLNACKEVLKVGGFIHLSAFDIQRVGDFIASGKVDERIMEIQGRAVFVVDTLFGSRDFIKDGNISAMHKSAYSAPSLGRIIKAAGFFDIQVKREKFEIICAARKGAAGMVNTEEKIAIFDNEKNANVNNIETEPVQWKPIGLKTA